MDAGQLLQQIRTSSKIDPTLAVTSSTRLYAFAIASEFTQTIATTNNLALQAPRHTTHCSNNPTICRSTINTSTRNYNITINKHKHWPSDVILRGGRSDGVPTTSDVQIHYLNDSALLVVVTEWLVSHDCVNAIIMYVCVYPKPVQHFVETNHNSQGHNHDKSQKHSLVTHNLQLRRQTLALYFRNSSLLLFSPSQQSSEFLSLFENLHILLLRCTSLESSRNIYLFITVLSLRRMFSFTCFTCRNDWI